jgi:hypothetical protein
LFLFCLSSCFIDLHIFQVSLEEPLPGTSITTLGNIGLMDLTPADSGGNMFLVRMSTPLLYVLNSVLGHLLPEEVFLVNREYFGLTQEKVHLCSIVCNINALLLQERGERSAPPKAITLAEVRKGARFFPQADEKAFNVPLIKRGSHLLVYKSVRGNFSAAHKATKSDASAALTPHNFKAVDLFLETDAGKVYFQTRGQQLMTKGFADTYGKAAKTLEAMDDVAGSFALPAHQGIAFELLTTRSLSVSDEISLREGSTPAIVVDRGVLKQVIGGVLAGYFERSDAFNAHMKKCVEERAAALAAEESAKQEERERSTTKREKQRTKMRAEQEEREKKATKHAEVTAAKPFDAQVERDERASKRAKKKAAFGHAEKEEDEEGNEELGAKASRKTKRGQHEEEGEEVTSMEELECSTESDKKSKVDESSEDVL